MVERTSDEDLRRSVLDHYKAKKDAEDAQQHPVSGRPEKGRAPRKRKPRERFHMDCDLIDMGVIQFLSGTELRVYTTLCRYADAQGRVTMSQPMLADKLDVNERTVRRALAKLEELGFIRKWQVQYGATGQIRIRPLREQLQQLILERLPHGEQLPPGRPYEYGSDFSEIVRAKDRQRESY